MSINEIDSKVLGVPTEFPALAGTSMRTMRLLPVSHPAAATFAIVPPPSPAPRMPLPAMNQEAWMQEQDRLLESIVAAAATGGRLPTTRHVHACCSTVPVREYYFTR